MNQIASTDERYPMIHQCVLPSRDMTHQKLSKPDDMTIKLVVHYRPIDIYWSMYVNNDTVTYKYSISLDGYNSMYHHWVLK